MATITLSNSTSLVKQLDITDKYSVMYLIEYSKGMKTVHYDRWEKVMIEGYLPGKTHKLFGSFKGVNGGGLYGSVLASIVGCRLDFPYEGAWVLSALKVNTNRYNWKNSGLIGCMSMLYQHMEALDYTEYYSCMTASHYRAFNKIFSEHVPEYAKYTHQEIMRISPGCLPVRDSWRSIMGRVPNYNKQLIIKRATLK